MYLTALQAPSFRLFSLHFTSLHLTSPHLYLPLSSSRYRISLVVWLAINRPLLMLIIYFQKYVGCWTGPRSGRRVLGNSNYTTQQPSSTCRTTFAMSGDRRQSDTASFNSLKFKSSQARPKEVRNVDRSRSPQRDRIISGRRERNEGERQELERGGYDSYRPGQSPSKVIIPAPVRTFRSGSTFSPQIPSTLNESRRKYLHTYSLDHVLVTW